MDYYKESVLQINLFVGMLSACHHCFGQRKTPLPPHPRNSENLLSKSAYFGVSGSAPSYPSKNHLLLINIGSLHFPSQLTFTKFS